MTERVLLGTTNPSKVRRFTKLLAGCDVQIVTPAMLHIAEEPAETGRTPLENACIKAAFYSRFCGRVIANDSGLYIDALPPDDPRQPGVHVRSPQGKRLDDEAMIAYYAGLAHALGGRVRAYYMDGVAVCRGGELLSYTDAEERERGAFYLLDTPHEKRHPGWPLDSLSVHIGTGLYFVERERMGSEEDDVIRSACWERLRAFLHGALKV